MLRDAMGHHPHRLRIAAHAGCSLCAGASVFCAFFMFFLGVLIKNNYQ